MGRAPAQRYKERRHPRNWLDAEGSREYSALRSLQLFRSPVELNYG